MPLRPVLYVMDAEMDARRTQTTSNAVISGADRALLLRRNRALTCDDAL